ncbi:MAG TPA: CDGSH iron-sulfur domain-containing protein [Bacteroidaceae bacterium]|nr:CDGSH iron-sulfur domain-containing protein [Bacteroidaceae bacterium]
MEKQNATLKALSNGPLEITGKFTITDSSGKEIAGKGPVYLCRCGGSKNKPFCDGTHNVNGFSG